MKDIRFHLASSDYQLEAIGVGKEHFHPDNIKLDDTMFILYDKRENNKFLGVIAEKDLDNWIATVQVGDNE